MQKLSNILLVLWCLLLLGACSSIQWTTVERLYPADSKIPERVRRVAVVNNQPDLSKENGLIGQLTVLDSKEVADSLAQYLADVAYFDQVVIYDSTLTSSQKLEHDGRELRPTQVLALSRMLDVDMLVSVELAVFTPGEYPYTNGFVCTLYKLYLPGSLHPLDTLYHEEEIYWDGYSNWKKNAIRAAASAPLPALVPLWENMTFPYYSGANVDMRDANIYVQEGNWEEARTLWERQLKHKNRQRRMEANFNMAVWHEVHDDSIGTAREYAKKALELSKKTSGERTWDYHFISEYIHDMEKRGKALERLKQQMQRFSDDF